MQPFRFSKTSKPKDWGVIVLSWMGASDEQFNQPGRHCVKLLSLHLKIIRKPQSKGLSFKALKVLLGVTYQNGAPN